MLKNKLHYFVLRALKIKANAKMQILILAPDQCYHQIHLNTQNNEHIKENA